jgi:large subunit ribosomal protein L21
MNLNLKPELESAIRARAYQIWEDEGRPHGRHESHWQRAYEAIADLAPVTVAAPLTVAEDISLIDGIGPKISKQLASVGIISLSHIASLSIAELAAIDLKLGLKGRSDREEWIAQAKELLAGKAPRAKVDQSKSKKK